MTCRRFIIAVDVFLAIFFANQTCLQANRLGKDNAVFSQTFPWASRILGEYALVAHTQNIAECPYEMTFTGISKQRHEHSEGRRIELAEIRHEQIQIDGEQCTGPGRLLVQSETEEELLVVGFDNKMRNCGTFNIAATTLFLDDMPSKLGVLQENERMPPNVLTNAAAREVYMGIIDRGDSYRPWGCWYLRMGSEDGSGAAVSSSGPDSETYVATVGPDSKSSDCFPGTAIVVLENGMRKMMRDVQVGDRVQVGDGEYSDVFMFTHRSSHVMRSFVTIRVDQESIKLHVTPDHLIYVRGLRLISARNIRAGDEIVLGTFRTANVTRIEHTVLSGLFNPHTIHGDIVVDGVLTSTYTECVQPSIAHAALWLLRNTYRVLGFDLTRGCFEQGAPRIVTSLLRRLSR